MKYLFYFILFGGMLFIAGNDDGKIRLPWWQLLILGIGYFVPFFIAFSLIEKYKLPKWVEYLAVILCALGFVVIGCYIH